MTIPELEEQLRQRDALIKEQARRIKELEMKIGELKELLVEKAKSKESKPPKEAMNYGLGQHERKQRKKRRRRKSPGRVPKDAKPDRATLRIDLHWHGARRKKCVLRREQFVWRLIDGKAVLTEVLGEQFDGIGVTDDYSAYHSQFTEHQFCWAHFLRKAIVFSGKSSLPFKRQPALHPEHLLEVAAIQGPFASVLEEPVALLTQRHNSPVA